MNDSFNLKITVYCYKSRHVYYNVLENVILKTHLIFYHQEINIDNILLYTSPNIF